MTRRPRGDEPAEHQLQLRLNTAEVESLDAQRLPGEARSSAARRLLGLALTKADPYPARVAALERLKGILPPEIEASVRAYVPPKDLPPFTEADWLVLAMNWSAEVVAEHRLFR